MYCKYNNISNNKNDNILDKIPNKLPWVEKYRPTKFEDILLDHYMKEKIYNIINNKFITNMIITGDPSTGKTSSILYLAKTLYKNNYDEFVLELNASDDRCLTVINNIIIPFCKKKNKRNNYPFEKMIILDEADSLTHKTQCLLSNIITDYSKSTIFIFICNSYNEIIESIQSKCMILKFPKISKYNLINKIKYICDNENIKYNNKGIDKLLYLSEYDIRQSINNLECLYYTYNNLNDVTISKIIEKPKLYYFIEILNYCYKKDFSNIIEILKIINNKGFYPNDLLYIFMNYIFDNNTFPDLIFNLNEKNKLEIYKIISMSYMNINENLSTFLQFSRCICLIYEYILTIS